MEKQNDLFTHLSIFHMKINEIKLYATICMRKQPKKSTYSSMLCFQSSKRRETDSQMFVNEYTCHKNVKLDNSLVVQWLGLHIVPANSVGSIPVQRTKIP